MRLAVCLVILCSLPVAAAIQTPTYWEAEGYAYWIVDGATFCEGTLRLDALRPMSLEDDARTSVHGVAHPITEGCDAVEIRFTSASDGLDAIEEDWGCDDRECYGAALAWSDDGEGVFEYRGAEGVDLLAWVHATRVVRL